MTQKTTWKFNWYVALLSVVCLNVQTLLCATQYSINELPISQLDLFCAFFKYHHSPRLQLYIATIP